MAVVLADVLEEERVTLDLRARNRNQALREIVLTMRGEEKVREPEKFLAEVIAREEAHTTYMGNGIAFPHARTNWVTQIILGIGRSRDGVPFDGAREPAQLIFFIGVPQLMVSDYLVCVGALARLTRERPTRAALMSAAAEKEIVEILRESSLRLE
ncbi:MAG: PTS sugar transporter subunit IIA [Chthoniobacterales bacterium]